MDSVGRLLLAEAGPGGISGGFINLQSGPRIAEARSQVTETYLTHENYKDYPWVLFIDSDMVFTVDDVHRILRSAHPTERPIVGGLCYAGYSPETMYPTLYSLVPEGTTWALEKVADFPENAMVKVGATGAAFLLCHRSALQQMYEAFHLLPNGQVNSYPWWVEGHVDHMGRQLGEDVAFCMRANSIGLPVFVHTGIKIGHRKNIILTEDVWKDQQALRKMRAEES
jgi:GT2 family glycosyltransferase